MRPGSKKPWLGACVLVFLVLIAYLPALDAGYIWDDDDYVTGNAVLQAPDGLKKIWTEPRSIPQYYPLVHTTFWIETRLWGLSPLGFHLVNVLLHGANAALLWLVLRRMAVPGAFLAAAVFALHPVHVESVAWVTERKNVLSAFFYLLTTLAWFRFRPMDDTKDRPDRRWYAIAFALFLCALLSKTVTATWPAAILLLVWWKHDRLTRRDFLLMLPFFLVGAASGLATAWWESGFVGAKGKEFDLGFPDRVLIAGRAIWFYLGKLAWPGTLTFIYPRWRIDPSDLAQWLWPLAAAGGIAGLWLGRHRIGRGPLAAALYFVGALFPALGFLSFYPMIYSFVADHFQYLASIGPITLATALATRAGLDKRFERPFEKMGRRIVAGALPAGLLLAVLAGLTWNQTRIYRDQETLWRDTLAKNPGAWIGWNNLGLLLLQAGKTEESVSYFERALRLNPDGGNAHYNLGIALAGQGRTGEASAHYRAAIRINPADADARNNLGSLMAAGSDLPGAVEQYREVIRIKPLHPMAHLNLANALRDLGDLPGALAEYSEAVRIDPGNADTHYNMGMTLASMGRMQEARVHLEVSRRLPAR